MKTFITADELRVALRDKELSLAKSDGEPNWRVGDTVAVRRDDDPFGRDYLFFVQSIDDSKYHLRVCRSN